MIINDRVKLANACRRQNAIKLVSMTTIIVMSGFGTTDNASCRNLTIDVQLTV